MPRIARMVAPNFPHHITQRGNYQQEIFSNDSDRKNYLSWLNEYCVQYKLIVLAYCLMSNHIHFIGIPEHEDSLAKTFNSTHMRYSQYFNKKMGVKGHLWQGRFFSCTLDEWHLKAATRYVERNPVRSGLVKKPWEWRWSSAAFHVGNTLDSVLKMGDIFQYTDMNPIDWKTYIAGDGDREFNRRLKKHTLSGRPYGSSKFIGFLEKKSGRRLKAYPRGRPKDKDK